MSGNPGKAAQTLTVTARDVVNQKFDLTGYPYRYLAVIQVGKIGGPEAHIPLVMNAVETLSRVGWELASFTIAHRTLVAVLRRQQ
jgi:hypothetical protein